jgi:hypothetical protein
MNDLPMHPIPECLRLFQINRDGPATGAFALMVSQAHFRQDGLRVDLLGDFRRRRRRGNREGLRRVEGECEAPNDWKIAPAVSTESDVTPSPMPKGTPPLWQARGTITWSRA